MCTRVKHVLRHAVWGTWLIQAVPAPLWPSMHHSPLQWGHLEGCLCHGTPRCPQQRLRCLLCAAPGAPVHFVRAHVARSGRCSAHPGSLRSQPAWPEQAAPWTLTPGLPGWKSLQHCCAAPAAGRRSPRLAHSRQHLQHAKVGRHGDERWGVASVKDYAGRRALT